MLSMGRAHVIAADAMLPICILALLLVLSWFGGQAARAEPTASNAPRIEWEIKNRFRLFRNEADFQRHVEATRSDGVLAAERRLAKESDGHGWARDTVERLCVDRTGRLLEFCERDGERENYLAPHDHRVGVTLSGTLPANEGCVWSFDDGDGHPRQVNAACDEEVRARLVSSRPTLASVDIVLPDGTALALAVENSHLAVTFIPLGCSGATINAGFLGNQRARECPGVGLACSGTVRSQISELTELLTTARRQRADRSLDLVLLTIGANDILFSGL